MKIRAESDELYPYNFIRELSEYQEKNSKYYDYIEVPDVLGEYLLELEQIRGTMNILVGKIHDYLFEFYTERNYNKDGTWKEDK